ncbi:Hypothetical_protein [Hexamita inflata]|uniref:Hypothetical_protein n=1 Tax=Hexamita inflata TaxID=28002 RepID=A0AA86R4U8_9EUKA|nr:Hypothetical protein HINF_LOCUS57027 [Hexamita inflata]
MTTQQFYIQGNSLIIIGLLLMDRYQQYLVAIFVSLKVPQVMNGVQHAFINTIFYSIVLKYFTYKQNTCSLHLFVEEFQMKEHTFDALRGLEHETEPVQTKVK